MKTKYKILAVVAPLVLVIDQITKLVVLNRLETGVRVSVVPGFFDLVHFRNTGAAFGLLSSTQENFRVPFFYIVAFVAVVLLILFYRSLSGKERLMPVALSLVFGGIAGNIFDRIWRGSVVDFLSFHIGSEVLNFTFFGRPFRVELEWPAFNVADSAITVAMFLILYSTLRKRA